MERQSTLETGIFAHARTPLVLVAYARTARPSCRPVKLKLRFKNSGSTPLGVPWNGHRVFPHRLSGESPIFAHAHRAHYLCFQRHVGKMVAQGISCVRHSFHRKNTAILPHSACVGHSVQSARSTRIRCSKWRITGCRQRKQWSASTPAFHRARVWRRRRPRKTTLGKSRYRTISRVRVDELLLAGGLRLRFPLPESVNPVPPSGDI